MAAGLAACGGGSTTADHVAPTSARGHARVSAAPPSVTTPPKAAAPAAPTTATTPPSAPPTTQDPGLLPPTDAVPLKDNQFNTEMAALWQAVTAGQPSLADSAFFPETAYAQVKAFYNDDSDWTYRLFAHFRLDVGAAHALLGADAASAQLVSVAVGPAHWIPAGACANRLGYWNSLDSRVVYRVGGVIRSFGIAALDGWRGEWYVIHLGSETPPAGQGVVDDAMVGAGLPGGSGGC